MMLKQQAGYEFFNRERTLPVVLQQFNMKFEQVINKSLYNSIESNNSTYKNIVNDTLEFKNEDENIAKFD